MTFKLSTVVAEIKAHPIRSILLALLLGTVIAQFASSTVRYLTADPNSPIFNPADFSLDSYRSEQDLYAALSVLLPPGTPKEVVDRLLIGAAGLCPSNGRPANEVTGFRKTIVLSGFWSAANFFVDYMQPAMPSRKRFKSIRILYDGETRTVREVHAQIYGSPRMPFFAQGAVLPKWFPQQTDCPDIRREQ